MKTLEQSAKSFARMPGTEKWPWRVGFERIGASETEMGRVGASVKLRPCSFKLGESGPILIMTHKQDPNFLWSVDQFLERAKFSTTDGEELYLMAEDCQLTVPFEGVPSLSYLHEALHQLGIRAHGLDEFAKWTEEKRQPYLAAWNKAMGV